MVRHGGSSAGSYLADPTSPIPSHCASIVATSTFKSYPYLLWDLPPTSNVTFVLIHDDLDVHYNELYQLTRVIQAGERCTPEYRTINLSNWKNGTGHALYRNILFIWQNAKQLSQRCTRELQLVIICCLTIPGLSKDIQCHERHFTTCWTPNQTWNPSVMTNWLLRTDDHFDLQVFVHKQRLQWYNPWQ